MAMQTDMTNARRPAADLLRQYLSATPADRVDASAAAFYAGLDTVGAIAPEIAASIVQELADQRRNIKLIASENYSSLATQCAMGNLLTDKYAEGIPHHRFYAGCDNVDSIEDLAHGRGRASSSAPDTRTPSRTAAPTPTSSPSGPSCGDGSSSPRWPDPGARGPSAAAGDWYKLTPDSGTRSGRSLGNQRLLGMDLASGGHLPTATGSTSRARCSSRTATRSTARRFLLDYDAIERQAARGQAADPAGRLQRLFAEHQLRPDARDRRRGRGGA